MNKRATIFLVFAVAIFGIYQIRDNANGYIELDTATEEEEDTRTTQRTSTSGNQKGNFSTESGTTQLNDTTDGTSSKQYDGVFLTGEFAKQYIYLGSTWFMNITKLQKPDDILIHPLSTEEPFFSRMKKIQRECEKDPVGDASTLINLNRMVYDDKHQVIMCIVPKNGCTTWKRIMRYIKGLSPLEAAFEVPTSKLVMGGKTLKTMGGLKQEEALWRLNNYTTFMVTRHPFHRLVSAHKSKFQVEDIQNAYRVRLARQAAVQSVRSYLPDLAIDWNAASSNLNRLKSREDFRKLPEADQSIVMDVISQAFIGNLRFQDFITYVVTRPGQYNDIHWRPQHHICNPCAINYDYVVRFDDLANEAERLLEWIQRNDPQEIRIHFPKSNSTVNADVAEKEFQRLPNGMREKLKAIYKRDFTYFDHDPNFF